VSTPTLAQARSHYDRQRGIAAAAAAAIRRLFGQRRPLIEVAATVSAYQLASATAASQAVAAFAGSQQPLTVPMSFAGVSSRGFPILEPIVAAIDAQVPAPAEAVPAPWWSPADVDTFLAEIQRLVASEVQDAGRSASQTEFVARPDWQNYVRMLTPPSCARCAILAGRIYRDLDAFQRHPLCDCVMIPVQDWQAAHDAGYVSSFKAAFEAGNVRGLSKADARAIRDGATPHEVVNATRGLNAPGITAALTTEVFGRRVKATTEGTTKRAAWRKANPTRLVRLRPEAIYQIVDREYGGDHEQAIRLLKLYGYIR